MYLVTYTEKELVVKRNAHEGYYICTRNVSWGQ